MPQRVLIFGAGLAGLACGYELARQGVPVRVLEEQSDVGGLSKSVHRNGFVVDLGPHRFHSGDPQLIEHLHDLLGENLARRERKSRIFMMDRWFYYPLRAQNVVTEMPKRKLVKILFDYAVARIANRLRPRPDDSFESWVTNRFGRELYRIFFGIYTEKTWGMPCNTISADWASQRISILSLGEVVWKTLWRRGETPRSWASTFYYPERGGVGEISRRYREEIEARGGEVITGARVMEVRLESGRVTGVTYENGGRGVETNPRAVVSTIPVNRLLEMMRPLPPSEILGLSSALRHRGLVFVYAVLDRLGLTDDHWIYIPAKERSINRVSEPRNFSPANVPDGQTVVCSEITCNFGDEVWGAPDEELGRRVAEELVELGFVREGEVRETFVHRERYGYPVYDIGYRAKLEACLTHLDGIPNLLTLGRQGLFRYNNMDHSVKMGLRAGHTILGRLEDYRGVGTAYDYFD